MTSQLNKNLKCELSLRQAKSFKHCTMIINFHCALKILALTILAHTEDYKHNIIEATFSIFNTVFFFIWSKCARDLLAFTQKECQVLK